MYAPNFLYNTIDIFQITESVHSIGGNRSNIAEHTYLYTGAQAHVVSSVEAPMCDASVTHLDDEWAAHMGGSAVKLDRELAMSIGTRLEPYIELNDA